MRRPENAQRSANRRRRDRERQERLALIDEQIANGELRVRQATDAERAEWKRDRARADRPEDTADQDDDALADASAVGTV
jgi:hypothetical protein